MDLGKPADALAQYELRSARSRTASGACMARRSPPNARRAKRARVRKLANTKGSNGGRPNSPPASKSRRTKAFARARRSAERPAGVGLIIR
jgi:hypothetical protein